MATLKLKTNVSENITAFLEDYKAQTTANPFDPRERVWKNVAGMEVSAWEGNIHISSIRSFEKGTGTGSKTLEFLCQLADKHGVTLQCEAEPYGDDKSFDQGKLVEWYKRHGFEGSEWEGMVRLPKELKTATEQDQIEEANSFSDEKAFMDHHNTGYIQSDAYENYEKDGGLDWEKLEAFPVLLKKVTLKDGTPVELRQSGRELKYTKWIDDELGRDIARGADGKALYLSPEEVEAKGYPAKDTTIAAFTGEGKTVGLASDEFGADGVWVVKSYQGKGLGTILLTEFRKQFGKGRRIGQMTSAGQAMARSYYNALRSKTADATTVPILYHGTCREYADKLLRDGFSPGTVPTGGNGGQSRYLYLTNFMENAQWFANEKGCDVVLEVRDVPKSLLKVDPEDGIATTVDLELNNEMGLPGNVVLHSVLPASHFHEVKSKIASGPAQDQNYDDSITQTPAFKAWFGKSKVVDDHGRPLRVYHGTRESFEAFDPSKATPTALYGPGLYFTQSPEVASGNGKYTDPQDIVNAAVWNQAGYAWQGSQWEIPELTKQQMNYAKRLMNTRSYVNDAWQDIGTRENRNKGLTALSEGEPAFRKWLANEGPRDIRMKLLKEVSKDPKLMATRPQTIPVFLRIVNPFYAESLMDKAAAVKIFGEGEYITQIFQTLKQRKGSDVYEAGTYDLGDKVQANEALRRAGYDGIQHTGGRLLGTVEHPVWIAFEPNQIKSAIGNNGNFDDKDHRITASTPEDRISYYSAQKELENIDKTVLHECVRLIQTERQRSPRQVAEMLMPLGYSKNDAFTLADTLIDTYEPMSYTPDPAVSNDKTVFKPGKGVGPVYHGSSNEFDTFDFNRIGEDSGNRGFFGAGMYFSADPEVASAYGKIKAYQLDVHKPLIINCPLSNEASSVLNAVTDSSDFFGTELNDCDGIHNALGNVASIDPYFSDNFTELLLEAGYDAVFFNNMREIVVFSSEVIKPYVGKKASTKTASPEDLDILKGMLTLTDAQKGEELAMQNPYNFREWIDENHPDLYSIFPATEEQELEDYSQFPANVLEEYVEPGSEYIMQNDPATAPSFVHMDFVRDVNDEWLVHFTNNAHDIASEGFTKGVDDPGMLGLTTYFTDAAKQRGGYNFAFSVEDLHRWDGQKYGKECVLFRASGIEVYHHGDNEPQVIFWGADAHDRIPIIERDLWCVVQPEPPYGVMYEADKLEDAVQWGMKNYDLYADPAKRQAWGDLYQDLLDSEEMVREGEAGMSLHEHDPKQVAHWQAEKNKAEEDIVRIKAELGKMSGTSKEARNITGIDEQPELDGEAEGIPASAKTAKFPPETLEAPEVTRQHNPDITSTPAFKAWFKNSKVVDAEGNPLVVYHGTNADFDSFDTESTLIFFTSNPKFADIYATEGPGGNVIACYLSLQHPFDFSKDHHLASEFWYSGLLDSFDIDRLAADYYEILEEELTDEQLDSYGSDQFEDQVLNGSWVAIENGAFVHFLKKQGYDGLLLLELGVVNYVAFDPKQVKSAIGNLGNFDPEDHRITAAHNVGDLVAHTGPASKRSSTIPQSNTKSCDIGRFLHRNGDSYKKASDEYLYHGTTKKTVQAILASGSVIQVPSYWGSERIAEYYAETTSEEDTTGKDEPVVIAVPLTRFSSSALHPDMNSVAEPLTFTLGAKEDELYEEWEESGGTWQDCLEIYESIVYNEPIKITSDDLPEGWSPNSKTAYISPKEAILAVAVDLGQHPVATITLDLGIPNFTVFSIKLPVEGVELDQIGYFIEQAVEAMLDDVSAYMISMHYPEEEVVKIYKLTLKCFEKMGIDDATDAGMDADDNIRFYEASFEIPESFIQQTLDKVVTAASRDVTETPAFKVWFGDSKVVDKQGKPLIVYHGTYKLWDKAKTAEEVMQEFLGMVSQHELENIPVVKVQHEMLQRAAGAVWFTDSEAVAAGYESFNGPESEESGIIQAYLKMSNPLDMREHLGAEALSSLLTEIFGETIEIGNGDYSLGLQVAHAVVSDNTLVVDWAKKNGYDGLIYPDTDVRGRPGHASYVVFYPSQIKSATGNNGAFDPNNHNITASSTQRLPPAPRRHWEFTTLKPRKDDPARTIQMYRSRSLKSTPRPYYIMLYDRQGRGVGVSKIPKEWEKRLSA